MEREREHRIVGNEEQERSLSTLFDPFKISKFVLFLINLNKTNKKSIS
jgi:hypothetical protein